MSGVKDGYSVHFPCRHCMASKDQMGNLSTDANGNFEFLKHRLRTQKCLESAKASFHPARLAQYAIEQYLTIFNASRFLKFIV